MKKLYIILLTILLLYTPSIYGEEMSKKNEKKHSKSPRKDIPTH